MLTGLVRRLLLGPAWLRRWGSRLRSTRVGLLTGNVCLVLGSSLSVASMLLLGLLTLSRLVGGLFLRPAGLGGWSRRLGSTGVRLLARSGLARLVWLVLRLLLGPSGLV